MLSIGKLGHGQERYYIESVATGAEDYYLGGEAPGVWVGAGAASLGLAGRVEGEQLSALLNGADPISGERLGKAHKVPAFDLTFRAPKSVSILFGIANPEISRVVREAHDDAVRSALDYLERHATWTRRGRGGIEQLRVEGIVAASFRHRTSRAGDPHLHTHVVVANTALGTDGVWATLDARHFYGNAKTIGHLYEAELRHLLSRRLGVPWGEVRNGIADIDGVPTALMATLSTRRAQIEEAMDIRGQHSARAAQIATLTTRRTKATNVDAHALTASWTATAAAHGLGPDEVVGLLGREQPAPFDMGQQITIEQHLLSEEGLTAKRATFDRNKVIEAWCDQLPAGATVDTVERLAEEFLGLGLVRRLDTPSSGAVIRDRNGRVLSALPATARYTTLELLTIEADAVERAGRLLGREIAVVAPSVLTIALRANHGLSEEQARAVVAMTTSGNGVDVLTAPAGAGKTTALAAARDAWERSGFRVIGAAHTGVAADELTNSAGIPATTIARLHITLDNSLPGGLDNRTVLVVDEAGNAGTRSLARLLHHAEQAGAKVVLLGDPRQLPEIDAGGLFAGLIARQPAIELTDNHRQRHEWEREALNQLRTGSIPTALTAYNEQGRIITAPTARDTKSQLVANFWATHTTGADTVMLASRRADVAELNLYARTRASAAGHLTGPVLSSGGRDFQTGDRVLMLRNNRQLQVKNGNRGTVIAVDPEARTMTVRLARRTVEVPSEYLESGYVDHAYAMTVHKSQGLTCDHTHVLASDELYRELGYTALSRGRHTNTLYLTTDPRDLDPDLDQHLPPGESETPEQSLEAALRRSHAQRLALDHQIPAPPSAWTLKELNAERSRLRAVLAGAPADQTAKLQALAISRQQALEEATDVSGRIAALPRRIAIPGRKPDPARVQLTEREDRVRARLDAIDRDVVELHAAQHRRDSYLAAHTADAGQLDRLDRELTHRINTAVGRSALQPHIHALIGPRPSSSDPRALTWIDAVQAIETYRHTHDITDTERPLGAQPAGGQPLTQWYAINHTVSAVRLELGLELVPPADSGPERGLPGIELA